MSKLTCCVLAAFVLLALSAAAHAQSAAVSGVVTDASGGAVANVQVTLTNEKTGAVQQTKTDGTGLYSLPFVQPGQYTLAAELAGFKRYEQTTITLETAQNRTIDVKLQVGDTQQSVTVNDSGIEMNTTDGSVGTIIDQTFVANIPLNGRSVQDLIDLTPGVSTMAPASSSVLGVEGDFNINGQRSESNNYVVDGVTANFSAGNGSGVGDAGGSVPAVTALGTSQALFSLDDLQEFRVLSSSYSAEYGHATGGQLIFLTRSGTNALHGSVYDYLRNGVFDANNWFNNSLGQPKTSEQQNDFGGTFGGPVRIPRLYNGKDKTFFFFSYEGLRLIQPQAALIVSVPDLNLRANSAAAIQPILNAYPLPNGPEETLPCSGTTFSNTTPYPCPSGDATGTQVPSGVAEFAQAYSAPSSLNATSGRLDHNFSSKMSAFFRFSVTPSDSQSRGADYWDDSVVSAFNSYTMTYTLGITNQLSNSINNSLRLGYGSNDMYNNGYLDAFGGATPIDYAAAVGAVGLSPWPAMRLTIPGTAPIQFYIPDSANRSRQWNLVDTVSITKGHHQLKFGFDYRRVSSLVQGYSPDVVGNFTNAWQIENNLASTFQVLNYQPEEPLFKEWALFAQDEWRIASRLSLSLGLRWDVDGPPTPASGQDAFTLEGSWPSSLALAPRGTPLWQTPYLNFAPRLGVAYQVRANPGWETILRSGAGVFFDNDNWLGSGAYEGPGFLGTFSCPAVTCGYPTTPAQLAAAAPPLTAPYTSTSVYDFPTHMQLPYSLQWNLSVQQSLGTAQSLTVSYVGADGRRLPNLEYFSLSGFNPNFKTVISAYGDIHSNYNALQASFQRKLSHGVQALASYTWGHSLDNLSEGIGLNIGQREFPPQWGNSDFDLRQNFATGVSWDLPGLNHDSVTKAALSHWGLDVHFVARSGFPVQVIGPAGVDPTTGLAFYSGVSLNPGVPLYLYGAACTAYYIANGNPNNGGGCPGGRAVNPAAYTATGSLSNPAPKNYARGFGENQINMAIRRDFPIRETLKLQFRGEIFNILNQTNFGYIDGSVGDSTFGLATMTLNNSLPGLSALYQQGGQRSMQFALKLIF